jgi:uncharacterized tellurite resistance protein B-like protein
MALVDFSKVRQLFGERDEAADDAIFRELFVLVLARATDADAYSHPAEVSTVQRVIRERLGEEISSADVRTAALSRLYETVPLHKCLAEASPRLSREQRRAIVEGLVEVMRADERISSSEAEFFNMVVQTLGLTAADAAGLSVD